MFDHLRGGGRSLDRGRLRRQRELSVIDVGGVDLIVRYLFGLTGTALTNGALGGTATRNSAAVNSYLDEVRTALDVDGNGMVDGWTDALLVLRYLFELRGSALISGAVGPNATRATEGAIEAYLQSLAP